MPEFLHEVFGEKQSAVELICVIIFAVIGSIIIYSLTDFELPLWQVVVGFILIADVLAGCIANFSFGTNAFYASRAKNRFIFITIHVHILLISWLLNEPIVVAGLVWLYTIASAFFVNALKGKIIQRFVAANLMCYGILLLINLSLPTWFLIICIFFMIKVLFSFAVDHYQVIVGE
jgi:hypothetical protein